MRDDLTAVRLREVLDYDPDTGSFTWRESKGHMRGGLPAGHHHNNGYVHIGIDGEDYSAHRLAWLYIFGAWPTAEHMDHINRVRHDNRICNLREASRSENGQNVSLSSSNSSGYRGVSRCNKYNCWRAQIKLNGKPKHLGYFETPQLASAAYCAAAALLHTHNPATTPQPPDHAREEQR